MAGKNEKAAKLSEQSTIPDVIPPSYRGPNIPPLCHQQRLPVFPKDNFAQLCQGLHLQRQLHVRQGRHRLSLYRSKRFTNDHPSYTFAGRRERLVQCVHVPTKQTNICPNTSPSERSNRPRDETQVRRFRFDIDILIFKAHFD